MMLRSVIFSAFTAICMSWAALADERPSENVARLVCYKTERQGDPMPAMPGFVAVAQQLSTDAVKPEVFLPNTLLFDEVSWVPDVPFELKVFENTTEHISRKDLKKKLSQIENSKLDQDFKYTSDVRFVESLVPSEFPENVDFEAVVEYLLQGQPSTEYPEVRAYKVASSIELIFGSDENAVSLEYYWNYQESNVFIDSPNGVLAFLHCLDPYLVPKN